MSVLNERTEITKRNVHLLCTTLCDRVCPHCCNKLYSFESIPYATEDELKECENIFLTGGEPFAYAQPNNIAKKLKEKYSNIKKVIVYTNAVEFATYLRDGGKMQYIDGLTVSMKSPSDKKAFEEEICRLQIPNSICYYFGDKLKPGNFEGIKREWKPAADSIFRKI